jgi:hypothetical protein
VSDGAGQMRFIARHGVLFEDNRGENSCIFSPETIGLCVVRGLRDTWQ